MANEVRIGPAALLKARTSWFDPKVVFATKDDSLEAAAMMVWKISKAIRSRQGEMGLSNTALGVKAGVSRQTVGDVLAGTSWPDARTMGRLCFVLGLDLVALNDGNDVAGR